MFLPDDLHELLRREAFAARVSMAELIRSRLERGGRRRRSAGVADPVAQVEGIVSDGHLSEDVDEALYSR